MQLIFFLYFGYILYFLISGLRSKNNPNLLTLLESDSVYYKHKIKAANPLTFVLGSNTLNDTRHPGQNVDVDTICKLETDTNCNLNASVSAPSGRMRHFTIFKYPSFF